MVASGRCVMVMCTLVYLLQAAVAKESDNARKATATTRKPMATTKSENATKASATTRKPMANTKFEHHKKVKVTNDPATVTSKVSGRVNAKKPMARMDTRVAVSGDDSKEKIPTKQALFSADLTHGDISSPDPDAYPGLSDYQRERLQCRDSNGKMHKLAAKYLSYGVECTYYECEYNADINGASWMLSRDIFKCCFEEKYAYKEGAVMQGKCTKKVCKRDGEDNQVEGSVAWEFRETGCKQCAIGLVMLNKTETFYTGDPCLHFQCGDKGKLIPAHDPTCCRVNDTLVVDGQLAMTRVGDDCEVSTCRGGQLTSPTNYQPNITVDDYVSGCHVHWSHIQGTCYISYTRPLALAAAARHCGRLAPARNSRLMLVDFGGMIGTMSDVMELGRWYWLVLRTRPDSPRFMWDNTTTPERFLVGHHDQPTVKRVNKLGKLTFQPSAAERNAYVCQMDHRPSCKPTGYTERPPGSRIDQLREEF